MAVASTELYLNHLHLASDREPCQHLITQFFTGQILFLMPNQQCQSTEGRHCFLENISHKVTPCEKYFPKSRGLPNFARCSVFSCTGTLHVHFRGLLPPDGILPGAKFTLCPSLVFSLHGTGVVRIRLSQNVAALSRGRHLYSAGQPSWWALAHILVWFRMTCYYCTRYSDYYKHSR